MRTFFSNIYVFLYICLMLALSLSACSRNITPIPTGDVKDTIKNEASFYSIRGGRDYDRLPLRFPYQIIDTTGEPALCEGIIVVVENVEAINVHSNLIFGKYGETVTFGTTNRAGYFFIDASAKTNCRAIDEASFQKLLNFHGMTNKTLAPVRPLIKEFMFNGTLSFRN
jgi:hypothetical protein